MFTVSVETSFWASHQLTLPDGSKEPVHRHNWSVTAQVSSSELNRIGLVMDFNLLREMVDNIVAQFDNIQLSENAYFKDHNPSAENVAGYIYDQIEPKLPKVVKLEAVKVIEEPGCSAKFSK